jgi:O-antigen/teichoic acid export membrane protein
LFSQLSFLTIQGWIISAAVVDITITCCTMALVTFDFLFHGASYSVPQAPPREIHYYFGEMRDRVSRAIRVTIQTGLLTSILITPVPALYVRLPETGAYAVTYVHD